MMTTVGRGRGNWGVKDITAPLRRPGEASRTNSEEEDNILLEITQLNLNDKHKCESLEEQIKNYCDNREHLWKMTQKLYDCSLRDRLIGEKVIKLWKNMSKFEVNEVKLRSVIMSAAQKGFEEREEIRKENSKLFLNAVALFGGLFHHLTLPNGEPYMVLVNPMLEYLQFLLQEDSTEISCREAELELLALQLNLNGNLLKKYAEESLAKFTLQIRNVLVGSFPSEKCKYWLLLILDLSTHGWNHQSFPPHLKAFYIENIGKSFHQLDKVDISTPSAEEESKKNIHKHNVEGSHAHVKRQEIRISQENNTHFKGDSYDKNSRKSWQDGNNELHERRKPPYWGHDDRFDKQDDSYQGGGYGSSDMGGRRGGTGGRGNWRGRGEGRPRRDRWNDESPKDISSTGQFSQSEESW